MLDIGFIQIIENPKIVRYVYRKLNHLIMTKRLNIRFILYFSR